MKMLVLTGPPGAGKNTIAHSFASNRERCVIVDVDTVRQMLVQPHKAPWDGDEGRRQQMLGVKNACALAKNFAKENLDVVILDVLSDETANAYKERLKEFSPRIVLLLPTVKEIRERNEMREKYLTDAEISMLYQTQEILRTYDEKIDNSALTAEQVAQRL